MADGPTQATLCDLDIPDESYYSEDILCLNNYMWRIEDHLPTSESELWKMFGGKAEEYSRSIKIRGDATSTGEELKRNFLTENGESSNYAALDYAQRPDTIEDPTGDTDGVIIEWEAVRISDSGAQTLLKIQTLTNDMQKLLDGK